MCRAIARRGEHATDCDGTVNAPRGHGWESLLMIATAPTRIRDDSTATYFVTSCYDQAVLFRYFVPGMGKPTEPPRLTEIAGGAGKRRIASRRAGTGVGSPR